MVDADCLLIGGILLCICISLTLLPQIFINESSISGNLNLRNGVQINNRQKYTPWIYKSRKLPSDSTEIPCSDGKMGYLNDDYCDCIDGEDETETSACSHILSYRRIYSCDHGDKIIFTSRISDGVYDCLDLTDE